MGPYKCYAFWSDLFLAGRKDLNEMPTRIISQSLSWEFLTALYSNEGPAQLASARGRNSGILQR